MKNQTVKAKIIADGLLNYLKTEKQTGLLPEIINILNYQLDNTKNTVLVESAAKLEPDEKEEVTKAVQEKLGWDGVIEFAINPDLLGGIKICFGDKVLDLSVKTKLKGIYEQI